MLQTECEYHVDLLDDKEINVRVFSSMWKCFLRLSLTRTFWCHRLGKDLVLPWVEAVYSVSLTAGWCLPDLEVLVKTTQLTEFIQIKFDRFWTSFHWYKEALNLHFSLTLGKNRVALISEFLTDGIYIHFRCFVCFRGWWPWNPMIHRKMNGRSFIGTLEGRIKKAAEIRVCPNVEWDCEKAEEIASGCLGLCTWM